MSILFVGKADSQSAFRQALEKHRTNSFASLGADGLQSMQSVCQQYQWVVLDVKSSGVGRDAAPSSSADQPIADLMQEQKSRHGCSCTALQFEYERAEVISYHQPREFTPE